MLSSSLEGTLNISDNNNNTVYYVYISNQNHNMAFLKLLLVILHL